MSQLTGRVAVVTGGASGMGLAIAQRLAAGGDRVGILDLNADAAQQAASDLRDQGHSAVAAQVDVSNRQAVEDALQKVRSEFGPIQILVTSAGLDEFAKFTDITAQMWDRMIAVNLTGTFHCVQAAVPDMLAGNWGRIVMISSSSAQSGAKRMAHYVASKGGVLALTKALGLEPAPKGITVTPLPPGFILTPMTDRAEAKGDLPDLQRVIDSSPMRRGGAVDDIAAAAAFLCSEEAGYITGQALNVNGGWYV